MQILQEVCIVPTVIKKLLLRTHKSYLFMIPTTHQSSNHMTIQRLLLLGAQIITFSIIILVNKYLYQYFYDDKRILYNRDLYVYITLIIVTGLFVSSFYSKKKTISCTFLQADYPS